MGRILIDMDREWRFHLGDISLESENSHSTSYAKCKKIHFENAYYRSDIGARAKKALKGD